MGTHYYDSFIVSSNRFLPSFYASPCCVENVEMLSKVQGRARVVHCSTCAVFSVARPHSHVLSPSMNLYFFRCSLLHVYPVRSLLRHRHVVHGLSCPLARLSSRLPEVGCGVLFVLLCLSLHLMTFGGKFTGLTECRKEFLDFKRPSAGICPYISSDARWRNSRQQVQFLYISDIP